jgi:hypothetical protein
MYFISGLPEISHSSRRERISSESMQTALRFEPSESEEEIECMREDRLGGGVTGIGVDSARSGRDGFRAKEGRREEAGDWEWLEFTDCDGEHLCRNSAADVELRAIVDDALDCGRRRDIAGGKCGRG